MPKVTLFGRSLCEPCKILKSRLREAGISFEEVDITTLQGDARKSVVKNILEVSQIETPTVPAVVLERNCKTTWFSNHGSCDVSEMFAEILLALQD